MNGITRVVLPIGVNAVQSVNCYVLADGDRVTVVDCGVWRPDLPDGGLAALNKQRSPALQQLVQVLASMGQQPPGGSDLIRQYLDRVHGQQPQQRRPDVAAGTGHGDSRALQMPGGEVSHDVPLPERRGVNRPTLTPARAASHRAARARRP